MRKASYLQKYMDRRAGSKCGVGTGTKVWRRVKNRIQRSNNLNFNLIITNFMVMDQKYESQEKLLLA